jgi:hypothetical protein
MSLMLGDGVGYDGRGIRSNRSTTKYIEFRVARPARTGMGRRACPSSPRKVNVSNHGSGYLDTSSAVKPRLCITVSLRSLKIGGR